MRIARRGRLALLVTVASIGTADAREAARALTVRAQDGVTLAATYYEASSRPAPGIILVHMLTRSKDDWQALAPRLADAGYAVLALDLRGHGGSGGGSRTDDGRIDVSRMILDVRAARAFFNGRPEIMAEKIGIGGASIGANLAVLLAADDPGVRSLALLSAGLDYQGLRIEAAMRKYGDRPAFLAAGANDPYAKRSLYQLAAAGTGLRETRVLDVGGHGTVLLLRSPDLIGLLVDWFQRTLV